MAEKRRVADFIVENDGDMPALEPKVTALLTALGVTSPPQG